MRTQNRPPPEIHYLSLVSTYLRFYSVVGGGAGGDGGGGCGAVVASNPMPNRNSQTPDPTHHDDSRGSSVMRWLWFGVGLPELLMRLLVFVGVLTKLLSLLPHTGNRKQQQRKLCYDLVWVWG